MKKSFKKIVSLVMAVMMLMTCFMVIASAVTDTTSKWDITVSGSTGTATINKALTSYSNTAIVIPDTVKYKSGSTTKTYTVTAIDSYFFYNSGTTNSSGKVTLPGSKVKYATAVHLPSSLKTIPNGLFQGNYFTYLKTIEIKGAGTTCNDYFLDCSALKEFIVNENNSNLKAIDGVLFSGDGATLMKFPVAKTLDGTTTYDVDEGTTEIRKYAFYKAKKITEVNVPASVETIGKAAFCGSTITAVNLEEGSTFKATDYECTCGTCLENAIFCANGHKSEFVERKPAACGVNAVNVNKCSVCGLTEEKEILGTALSHTGGTATCSALAVCGTCGKAYGEYNADAHTFGEYTYNNDATCENDGTMTATCANGCGEVSTVTAVGTAKGHIFNYETISAATCTKDAKETATCANGCGKTDTRDVAGSALGHSFTNYEVIRNETCKVERQEKAFCDNSDCEAYDVRTVKGTKLEHKAGEAVITGRVNPTCEKAGSYVETVKCAVCGDLISSEMKRVDALGHADENGDYVCDNGGEQLRSPQDDCTHMCHKSGILGFFWKIGCFFQKLFKTNPVCKCGAAHY